MAQSRRSGGLGGMSSTSNSSAYFNRPSRGLGTQSNVKDWGWATQKPTPTVKASTNSTTATSDKKETKGGGGSGRDQPVPTPRKKKTSLHRSPDLSGNSSTAESTKPRPHSFHGEDSLKGYEIVVMGDEPPRPPTVTTPNGAKPVPKPRTNNSPVPSTTKTSPLTIAPSILPSEDQSAAQVEPRSEGLPMSRHLSPYRMDQNNYSSSGPPSLLPMMDYSLEPRMFGGSPPMKLDISQSKAIYEEEDAPGSLSDHDGRYDFDDDDDDDDDNQKIFLRDIPGTSPPPKPPRRRESSPTVSQSPPMVFKKSSTLSDFQSTKKKEEKTGSTFLSKWSPKFARKASPRVKRSPSSGDVKTDVDEERRKAMKRLFKDPTLRKLRDFLEKPNADPNMRNSEGDTPLLNYVRHQVRSRLDRMYLILYHGRELDVNARDAAGNSALHIAAQKGDVAFAKALLVFGADCKLLNAKRQIPIDLAKGEIADILQCLAGKPEIEDDDAVASLPEEINVDLFDVWNSRLDHLISDRNIFNFTYWMETQLDKVNQGAMGLKSLTDPDITHSQAMQRVELRRWQDTAKPVRPGGRVLFLDGGGVRGLILVEMLMEIERRTGRKITELFDWFIGTSIGSVVAAGLVYANKSLKEIRTLLFRLKDEIFTGGGFRGTLLNVTERSRKLEELYEQEIGDALLSSVSKPRVMICAVNKTNLKVEFFNNFMDDPALTDVPVWKACRASSAAPIYFTSYDNYVDGGVMANNPCEYAMSEITRFYDERREKIPTFSIAVSVGTGYNPHMGVGDINAFCKGLFDFKKIYEGVKQLVDLFGKALSESENTAEKFANQCKMRQPPIRFFRFNPKLKEVLGTGETNDEKLVDMLVETKCYMASEESVSKMGEIITVFRLLAQYHAVMH